MAPLTIKLTLSLLGNEARHPTHWFAGQMGLSGKYDDIGVHVIIVILEASY
jgi:hypothetical protein